MSVHNLKIDLADQAGLIIIVEMDIFLKKCKYEIGGNYFSFVKKVRKFFCFTVCVVWISNQKDLKSAANGLVKSTKHIFGLFLFIFSMQFLSCVH